MNDHLTFRPQILYIDDDGNQLALVQRLLSDRYELLTAESGWKGLQIIKEIKLDLVLLDINMPEMNGYEVCASIQANRETAVIPVIFLTATGEEQDRARAFAVGGADYLVKPVQKPKLVEIIQKHLATGAVWRQLREHGGRWYKKMQSQSFIGFKDYVCTRLNLGEEKKQRFSGTPVSNIYTAGADLGIGENTMTRFMSEFLDLPRISYIPLESIRLGIIPTAFCKTNHVLPITNDSGDKGFIISNPFDLDLIETLRNHFDLDNAATIRIIEPSRIKLFFAETSSTSQPEPSAGTKISQPAPKTVFKDGLIDSNPVVRITDTILNAAVVERASDIHIEPKEQETLVRFRIDGNLLHAFTLKHNTGKMIISRLKVQGGMDISEKRKSQDGSFVATLDNRVFNFRLSTTSTPYGESLVMRLLEPYVAASTLEDLGMSSRQVETMLAASARTSGMILIVGATGSGKTTTIYSFLHAIDYKKRSIMSVEDPVEYRIPFVNQQQVNEKAGVTFDLLLKASVRQDPDVLFMGEVRDGFSAKMAVDFASTGHLTITTLHTTNATTAIFRLQRLGTDRSTMADAIIAIVAQKLLKKLCPHCKKTAPVSQNEINMLAPFTETVPSVVAHPVGCPKCRNTGYLGREGVYEILQFDSQIAEMVRSGAPISQIRSFSRSRGNLLIETSAVAKCRELVFTPKDIFENVLVEGEPDAEKPRHHQKAEPKRISGAEPSVSPAAILIVEDDEDTRNLLVRFLEKDGYAVIACEDGVEALLYLGRQKFDLILSDINMPNLDGFKLLEMINQKGIGVPVIFLTSRQDHGDETKGLELGASDYMKKPIQKEILRLRVKKLLDRRQPA